MILVREPIVGLRLDAPELRQALAEFYPEAVPVGARASIFDTYR